MRVAGAVDIGGTSTKIGVVAEDGTIVLRDRVPTSLHGEDYREHVKTFRSFTGCPSLKM